MGRQRRRSGRRPGGDSVGQPLRRYADRSARRGRSIRSWHLGPSWRRASSRARADAIGVAHAGRAPRRSWPRDKAALKANRVAGAGPAVARSGAGRRSRPRGRCDARSSRGEGLRERGATCSWRWRDGMARPHPRRPGRSPATLKDACRSVLMEPRVMPTRRKGDGPGVVGDAWPICSRGVFAVKWANCLSYLGGSYRSGGLLGARGRAAP